MYHYYLLLSLVLIILNPVNAGPVKVDTRKPFTCEKINVLYTWVDGSDPVHIASRAQRFGLDIKQTAANNRFRDLNGLMYSLRSIEKFAPWVNKIFIYTANQIPSYLNVDHPKIKLLFHDDVFPNKTDLPTFSSNAIEASFPYLPDEVGPCFIYLNDDVFFAQPVTPETFINPITGQILFEDVWTAPATPQQQKDEPWHASVASSNQILDKVYGQARRRYTEHGPHLMSLQVLREMGNVFGEAFENTMHNPLREGEDTALPFLYHHYTHNTYKSTSGGVSITHWQGIFDDGKRMCADFKWLAKQKKKVICLNDQISGEPSEQVLVCYYAYMDTLFPEKSAFEMY